MTPDPLHHAGKAGLVHGCYQQMDPIIQQCIGMNIHPVKTCCLFKPFKIAHVIFIVPEDFLPVVPLLKNMMGKAGNDQSRTSCHTVCLCDSMIVFTLSLIIIRRQTIPTSPCPHSKDFFIAKPVFSIRFILIVLKIAWIRNDTLSNDFHVSFHRQMRGQQQHSPPGQWRKKWQTIFQISTLSMKSAVLNR